MRPNFLCVVILAILPWLYHYEHHGGGYLRAGGVARALPRQPSPEDRLVLVRTLVAEAGWGSARDYAAILHVLDRRRRLPRFLPQGLTLAEMAVRYSKFHSPHKRSTRHRTAVLGLTLSTAPGDALAAVDSWYAGTLADPCNGRAMHWGSVQDYAGKRGQTVVDCGKTYNIFTQ